MSESYDWDRTPDQRLHEHLSQPDNNEECPVCGSDIDIDSLGDLEWADSAYWDECVCPNCQEWGSLMQGINTSFRILGDWETHGDAAGGMSPAEYAEYSRKNIIDALHSLGGFGDPAK